MRVRASGRPPPSSLGLPSPNDDVPPGKELKRLHVRDGLRGVLPLRASCAAPAGGLPGRNVRIDDHAVFFDLAVTDEAEDEFIRLLPAGT